jgi:GDP-L-fucose synthase
MLHLDDKIYVAGHQGLVGSALVRRLRSAGFHNLVLRSRAQLDLTDRRHVEDFFADERPDLVFLAAAKVGGIHANETLPADFIRENLRIETNVIDAAYHAHVRKLLFLGSSCIYPKLAPQPIVETALLTGPLEPTNQWYAIAKIAGIMLCQAYARQHGFDAISLMPTNLYGPGDNFHAQHAHVLPALMRRFHEAKINAASEVAVWGTGRPRREFLYVDDLADAAFYLMSHYRSPEIVNVGTGADISIRELVELIKDVVGYDGIVKFDPRKPDGTPRKLLDVTKLKTLGWRPQTAFEAGLRKTYQWFLENQWQLRGVKALEPAH